MRHETGFTFAEIMIVVSVMAILGGMILVINVKGHLQKARDSKRKQDLNKISRLMEDYYNDHQKYPPQSPDGTIAGSVWGSTFQSTLLPTDPTVNAPYFYQTDPNSGGFYAIYALLENKDDPDIERSGCKMGCGPGLKYNFVIHSDNVMMMAGLPASSIALTTSDSGGGGGTGGGGNTVEDTPTPLPTVVETPVPTGPTPTPITPIDAGCRFGQCGSCNSCGGASGQQCGGLSRCWYDSFSTWYCRADITCLWNPQL